SPATFVSIPRHPPVTKGCPFRFPESNLRRFRHWFPFPGPLPWGQKVSFYNLRVSRPPYSLWCIGSRRNEGRHTPLECRPAWWNRVFPDRRADRNTNPRRWCPHCNGGGPPFASSRIPPP